MPIRAGRPNGGEVLDEIGVSVVADFPKPLTDEVVQAAELVIIMGCGDASPIYPDRRYMEWPVAASIGQPLEDVRHIRDDIAGDGLALGASPSSRMRRGIPTI